MEVNVLRLHLAKMRNLAVALPAPVYNDSLISNKVRCLQQVLRKFAKQDEHFCGIVFVEKRWTASAIVHAITNKTSLQSLIKPAVLLGHGTNTAFLDKHYRSTDQNLIVRRFREREINLLITTSVAEEGLDVQPCSLVVRYDLCRTLTSYIQSRGRARRKNSHFVVFLQKDSLLDMHTLVEIKKSEEKFATWKDRSDANDDEWSEPSEYCGPNEVFRVESTGACISYNSSINLLHYFCATLPNDGYAPMKPQFTLIEAGENEKLFRVDVEMPLNSPVRQVLGKWMSNKASARRSACLEAIKELYKAGALDDHLVPYPTLDEEDAEPECKSFMHLLEGIAMDAEDIEGINAPTIDTEWRLELPWKFQNWISSDAEETITLKLHAFTWDANEFHGFNQFGLLCQEELQSHTFPIYQTGQDLFADRTMVTMENPQSVTLTTSALARVRRFNSFILRYVYLSHRDGQEVTGNEPDYIWDRTDFSKWDENYAFLFVPTTEGKAIDWQLIEQVYALEAAFQASSHDSFLDVVAEIDSKWTENVEWIVTDIIDYQRRLVVHKIDSSLNPHSELLPSEFEDATVVPPAKRENLRTYEDWYFAAHRRIPYTKQKLPVMKEDQPLCFVSRAPLLKNYLIPEIAVTLGAKDKSKVPRFRIPQFCIFCPITAPLFRSSALFPSILSRIESIWLAVKFQRDFDMYDVPLNLLLQALAAPSANLGYSYEALETLGDAFLKIAISLDLFIKYPTRSEGQLSYTKHIIVSNKALYRRAKQINLPKYIWTRPVSPKTWRIPTVADQLNVTTVKLIGFVRGRRDDGTLSDATVADVVEALIGAAYVVGGVKMCLRLMHRFNIPLASVSVWQDYIAMLPEVPDIGAKLDRNAVKDILGYQFQNPRLMEEALNHPSSQHRDIACYQRLEFLGDAVLDLVVAHELYKMHRQEDQNIFPVFVPALAALAPSIRKRVEALKMPLDPGRITDIKMLTVNNDTLGFISIAHSLTRHMIHFSEPLFQAVGQATNWAQQVLTMSWMDCAHATTHFDSLPWWWWNEDAVGDVDNVVEQMRTIPVEPEVEDDDPEKSPEFERNSFEGPNTQELMGKYVPRVWPQASLSMPKAASDILEASIGAVFLDSGFSLDVTFKLINRVLGILGSHRPLGQSQKSPLPTDMDRSEESNQGPFVSLIQWVSEHSWDSMYQRLHPLRKLQEFFESRGCNQIVFKEFKFDRINPSLSFGLGENDPLRHAPRSEEDGENLIPDAIKTLEGARAVTPDMFKQPVVGIYLHGTLLGAASGKSYKLARTVASREALKTLDSIIAYQKQNPESCDELLRFGIPCRVCSHAPQPAKQQ